MYIPAGQSPSVQLVREGKERKMILLQICLLPLSVLLLLGAIFAIGSAGVEQPDQSTWIDQDDAWIDERLSAVTTGFVHLPCQSYSFDVSGNEQVELLHTEIIHGFVNRDSLSELLIYKL